MPRHALSLGLAALCLWSAVCRAELSPEETAIATAAQKRASAAEALLERAVNIQSPTENVAGVRAVGDLFAAELRRIGMQTRWIDMPDGMHRAGHLVATTGGSKGKRVLMLSNVPRRVAPVYDMLAAMGIGRDLYDLVLSSGESAWRALRQRPDAAHLSLGKVGYHLGPARDVTIFDDGAATRGTDIATADFILCTGPHTDLAPLEDHEALLVAARARDLPMLCANPDLWVMRGDQRLVQPIKPAHIERRPLDNRDAVRGAAHLRPHLRPHLRRCSARHRQ